MPRNGSGVYTAPQNSWNPAVNGAQALPADWMAILQDLVAAMTQSTSADGQTLITGVWNFGNNRITGVGAPVGTGNALRWEQMIKGADIASDTTISIPIEGSIFDVTGTTTITSFDDVFPGRSALLRFNDAVELVHSSSLRLPNNQDRTTSPGDILLAVNTESGVWEIVYWAYWTLPEDIQWYSKPIGEAFPLWDHISGVSAPPTNNPAYRYIKLTAADSYNDGILTNESISGSAPNIVATAVVNLPDSPCYGETIPLINTERRFLRPGGPGVSGTRQAGQNASHTHGVNDPGHQHALQFQNEGPIAGPGAYQGALNASSITQTNVSTTGISIQTSGGDEPRPYNIGATYYMRIK